MSNSTKYSLAVLLATGLITACAPEERAFHAQAIMLSSRDTLAKTVGVNPRGDARSTYGLDRCVPNP